MVREVFSRDVQGEMGQPYTRSRYYHLYINGQYWGLYQTQERSEASYAESYFGGDEDDYDVVKSESGGYYMTNTDGDLEAYQRLYEFATSGLTNDESYQRVQGLNLDGTRNPGFERLLDVDNLIDLMIIDYYTGDRDGPGSRFVNRPNNIYGIYNRADPDGWKWFQHDGEHSLGVSSSETNLVTPFTTAGAQWRYFNPHWFHEQLARFNDEYRMRFADRVYRHFFNDGVLTPEASIARVQRRAGQIELAIIAESARWGDAKRSSPYTKRHWDEQIDGLVNDYLPTRTQVVLGQFRSVGWYPNIDPPAFNQHGGRVSSGFALQMSLAQGTVYYTMDGSDPRAAFSGAVSASARRYSGSIQLTGSVPIKARALSGTTWSALNEGIFAVGPVAESLRISEIMYHPADPNTEFVELTNIGNETIDLNLVTFTDGIAFTFPRLLLAPGDYTLVVENTEAFEARYGLGLPIAGQYDGSLANGGERLELHDAGGRMIQSLRFRDNWYDLTDGRGYSLTLREPAEVASDTIDDEQAWRPSVDAGGSPGFDDSGTAIAPGTVVINELMANPETGQSDWIELYNTSDITIDIGGWFLSDDADDPAKYEIAAGTVLAPYGYVVLSGNEHFGNETAPGCHEPFGLSRQGETLFLRSGSDGIVTGYSAEQTFAASEPGISLGRYCTNMGTCDFGALTQPTPNAANAGPRIE